MGFALQDNEELPVAFRRIALEQIDLALNHLGTASEDLSKSVHATRQSLKRLRALVALARGDLGDEVFARESTCYRGAGRLLAGGRDAAAVVQTFDAVTQRFPEGLTPEVLASEHRFLAERRDARLEIMVEKEGALQKASEMLVSARQRVSIWPLKRTGFKALREGVRRSYRGGREGLRSVIRHPSPTNFHEWRRPVKLLWHQLQILTPIWPPILKAHADELRNLSDRLNENHDLDVLRHIALGSRSETQPHDRQALIALLDRRCGVLEAEALPPGERLYIERPVRFVDRIEHYWRVWERTNRHGAIVSREAANLVVSAKA